jgi:ADP-ribosylglycohydrolase
MTSIFEEIALPKTAFYGMAGSSTRNDSKRIPVRRWAPWHHRGDGWGIYVNHISSQADRLSLSVHLKDRVAGCLMGSAVGEALAAPFVGEWGHAIPSMHKLTEQFQPYSRCEDFPAGQFSDKTQLMLACVEAIVVAEGIRPALVAQAMAELWATGKLVSPNVNLTRSLAKFHRTGNWRDCGAPEGYADSGPAARSGALGLYFIDGPDHLPETVANLARITHADERSVAGAVAIAKAAQTLAHDPNISPCDFAESIALSIEAFDDSFAELVRQVPDIALLPARSALKAMASAGIFDREFDCPIITSFVIPTVLASLWCVIRFGDDWSKATAAAIKLGGNVDALGAIVGSLVGIRLGINAIPFKLRTCVANSSSINRLSEDYSLLLLRASSHPGPPDGLW